jgi:hypothetical protein
MSLGVRVRASNIAIAMKDEQWIRSPQMNNAKSYNLKGKPEMSNIIEITSFSIDTMS